MLRNSRSWLLSIAAFALGCNAILGNDVGHLKAGAQSCTLNSDCKAGDLCIFAMCSVPCRTDVDCDTGSRCLETTKGAACVVSSAAACANDQSCPEGAVCSDQVCRAPCQTIGGTVCHGDQTCTAHVCLGADRAHDPATGDLADGSTSGGGTSNGGTRASGGALGGGGIRASGGASGFGGTIGAGGSTLDAGSGTGGTTTTNSGGTTTGSGGTGGTTGTGGVTASGGSTGIAGAPVATLKTMTIDILGGSEGFKCQDFANPFGGSDAAIVETNSTMPGIAEQTVVFFSPVFNTTTGSPVDCSVVLSDDFIHDAQTPADTMKYPADVGRLLKGTDGLRIWTHYFNTTTVTVSAQVSVSLHAVPPTTVHNYAAAMMLNNVGLSVPVTNNYTATKTYPAPYDIKMLRAVGLMYSHGTHYKANVGAQVLYEGTDWSGPTPALFPTPLVITSGDTVTWACTYQNLTGSTVRFGQSAATDEHCMFYGVFYATLPENQRSSILVQQP